MALSKKEISVLPSYNLFFTKDDFNTLIINEKLSVIVSKTIKAPFSFDSLVLSASAKLNKGSAILLQASVKTEKGWSGFYKLAYISKEFKKSFALNQDEYGCVDIDTLLPKTPASAFKFQITVLGKADIKMLCASFTNASVKYYPELALETLDLKDFSLPLNPVSQMEYKDKTLKTRICSPAALHMVLDYLGKNTSLEEIISGVYDNQAMIYGNWVLNTAFASQLGLKAFVLRCSSMAQAEGELLQGRPLIASIAFKKGALKNAPQEKTAGHLVVIAGFDGNGNPVVLDPAAPTAAKVLRIYDRKQFAEAWLKNKQGLAYAIGA